jgi:hypothetical protein
MESEEYELVTKRIGLYQQKLEKMPEEPDDKVRQDFFFAGLLLFFPLSSLSLSLASSFPTTRISRGLWTAKLCVLIETAVVNFKNIRTI